MSRAEAASSGGSAGGAYTSATQHTFKLTQRSFSCKGSFRESSPTAARNRTRAVQRAGRRSCLDARTGPKSGCQRGRRLSPLRFEARAAPSRLRRARFARRDPCPARTRCPVPAAVGPPRRSHRPDRAGRPGGGWRPTPRTTGCSTPRSCGAIPTRRGFPRDVGRLGSTARRRRVGCRTRPGRRTRSARSRSCCDRSSGGLFNEWRVTGDTDETRAQRTGATTRLASWTRVCTDGAVSGSVSSRVQRSAAHAATGTASLASRRRCRRRRRPRSARSGRG